MTNIKKVWLLIILFILVMNSFKWFTEGIVAVRAGDISVTVGKQA